MCSYNGHPHAPAPAFSMRRHGTGHRLSDHFVLGEFASRDGDDRVLVSPDLVALLEELRAHFGRPVSVNSGYRSPAHNARVGGKRGSRHLTGQAADVDVRGVSPRRVASFLATLDPGGLAEYRTFVHVDVQGRGRRWGINPRR